MSIQDKAKAAAKNVEGKIQETIGNVTGDSKDQLEGKAKQVEATARDKAADVGERIDNATDDATNDGSADKAKAAAKNVEGKVQDTFGRLTDSPEDQLAGKAKQAEASVQNTAGDVKNKVKKMTK
ncbi:MAG: CsbD family protein [Alkalinema sp. CAN_BIN05]|nr:CsbD family protein [Alkalinema sp. CAN_BIN05]